MKYRYLTLAILLIATPRMPAHDTHKDIQDQKSDTITKKTRTKHFAAGLVKLTATAAQMAAMGLLYKVCSGLAHNASAKQEVKSRLPALRKPAQPADRFEQGIACFLGGVTGLSLLYTTCKTGHSAWQSFKQAFARTTKNSEASQK